MDKYIGIVRRIIYSSDDNFFKIIDFETEDGELKCKGNLVNISIGDEIEIYGSMNIDKFGELIFSIERHKYLSENTSNQIYNFLLAGNIKYIGEKLAKKIVDTFADETETVLSTSPERLAEVRGISLSRAKEIVCEYNKNAHRIKNYVYLSNLGISDILTSKIINKYKDKTIETISNNPYVIINDIQGVSFKKADEIATLIGIPFDSFFRKKAYILNVLNEQYYNGNTYVLFENLIKSFRDNLLIEIDEGEFRDLLFELYSEEEIYIEQVGRNIRVYIDNVYSSECKVSNVLRDINNKLDINDIIVDKFLYEFECNNNIILDDIQKIAVKTVLSNQFVVITGGPGTGKTTLIDVIINYYEKYKYDVRLVAPTACAAKRMENITGTKASTIHRLLELRRDDNSDFLHFGRNSNNKLDTDVIIVDETSMLDLSLAKALLDAIKNDTRIIFVGDKNQLPSVGAGNVLEDIINSDVFPVVELKKVYRQNNYESKIISVANSVLNGESIHNTADINDDLFIIRLQRNLFKEQLINTLSKIADKLNMDIRDIQVLSPQKRGTYGVDGINKILQSHLNKEECSINFGDKFYKIADKVIHTKNNYFKEYISLDNDELLGIFNGEIGYINSLDKMAGTISVEYSDKRVEYDRLDINELNLAYSITVHKSQGSEYKAIIIVLGPDVHPFLRDRRLLYTAITRAKELVVMLTEESVVNDILRNKSMKTRMTGLCDKLRGISGVIKEIS